MTKESLAYSVWPALPKLFPTSFPGIITGQDNLLVDIDRDRLMGRLQKFQDEAAAERLQQQHFVPDNIIRYCYRPFDMRWLYWEPDTKLLRRPRPTYARHPFKGNLWLEARRRHSKSAFDRGYVVHTPADGFGNGVSRFFPLYLSPENKQFSYFDTDGKALHPNLTIKAMVYAKTLQVTAPNLFYHLVAILHSPHYRRENDEALRLDWPRIPLPNNKQMLRRSAQLGQQLVMLLNPEIRVPKVTFGQLRPELEMIGRLTLLEDEAYLENEPDQPARPDLTLTAGWGYVGRQGNSGIGPGQVIERDYTSVERNAIEKGGATLGLTLNQLDNYLGLTTYDVYLNDTTYWSHIPRNVWDYTLSGYSVIKKWLSYREQTVLDRALKPTEADEVIQIARRITAITLMTPTLDRNYQTIKRTLYHWPE